MSFLQFTLYPIAIGKRDDLHLEPGYNSRSKQPPLPLGCPVIRIPRTSNKSSWKLEISLICLVGRTLSFGLIFPCPFFKNTFKIWCLLELRVKWINISKKTLRIVPAHSKHLINVILPCGYSLLYTGSHMNCIIFSLQPLFQIENPNALINAYLRSVERNIDTEEDLLKDISIKEILCLIRLLWDMEGTLEKNTYCSSLSFRKARSLELLI